MAVASKTRPLDAEAKTGLRCPPTVMLTRPSIDRKSRLGGPAEKTYLGWAKHRDRGGAEWISG